MSVLWEHSLTSSHFKQIDKTTNTVTMANVAAIERAPYDVLFEVFQRLDYGDGLALSQTNKSLREFLDLDHIFTVAARKDFYLRAERFARNGDKLFCFTCWNLMPRAAFSNSQRTGPRGKQAINWQKASKRYCIDCGIKNRLFEHLTAIRRGKEMWYLCHICGEFKPRHSRCRLEKSVPAQKAGIDGGLRTRAISTTICTGPATPNPVSRLESLPDAIHAQIVRHLGYKAVLALARTNRRLRSTTLCTALSDPDPDALRERFQVLQPWARAPAPLRSHRGHHRGNRVTAPLACYGCFSVKPADRFTQWQRERLRARDFWRRRCSRCVQQAQTAAGAEALARWRRQTLCGRCRTMRWAGDKRGCAGCRAREEAEPRFREVVEARRRRVAEKLSAEGLDAILENGLVPWQRAVGIADAEPEDGTAAAGVELRVTVTPQVVVDEHEEMWRARFRSRAMSTAERSLYLRIAAARRRDKYKKTALRSRILDAVTSGVRKLLFGDRKED